MACVNKTRIRPESCIFWLGPAVNMRPRQLEESIHAKVKIWDIHLVNGFEGSCDG